MALLEHPDAVVALLIAASFSLLAYLLKSLSKSGAIATCLIGFLIYWLGGWKFPIPLLTFFISSSILSRFRSKSKRKAELHSAKGARRDHGQVLANGGVATLMVVLFGLLGKSITLPTLRILLICFTASIATMNADTWATEIGTLSKVRPRQLRDWKSASTGVSGAISLLGSVGATAGALLIIFVGHLLWQFDLVEWTALIWGSVLGCLTDSLLGAGVQVQYAGSDGAITERALPGTIPLRGVRWVSNDVVNLLASLVGALISGVLMVLVGKVS